MKKITSFTIDHTKLLPGLYVSREDFVGNYIVTTFDIRVCKPNTSDLMTTGEMHTIEHIAATYLRNHEQWQNRIIYFGPMGCTSGFYLIVAPGISPSKSATNSKHSLTKGKISFEVYIPATIK